MNSSISTVDGNSGTEGEGVGIIVDVSIGEALAKGEPEGFWLRFEITCYLFSSLILKTHATGACEK